MLVEVNFQTLRQLFSLRDLRNAAVGVMVGSYRRSRFGIADALGAPDGQRAACRNRGGGIARVGFY